MAVEAVAVMAVVTEMGRQQRFEAGAALTLFPFARGARNNMDDGVISSAQRTFTSSGPWPIVQVFLPLYCNTAASELSQALEMQQQLVHCDRDAQ